MNLRGCISSRTSFAAREMRFSWKPKKFEFARGSGQLGEPERKAKSKPSTFEIEFYLATRLACTKEMIFIMDSTTNLRIPTLSSPYHQLVHFNLGEGLLRQLQLQTIVEKRLSDLEVSMQETVLAIKSHGKAHRDLLAKADEIESYRSDLLRPRELTVPWCSTRNNELFI